MKKKTFIIICAVAILLLYSGLRNGMNNDNSVSSKMIPTVTISSTTPVPKTPVPDPTPTVTYKGTLRDYYNSFAKYKLSEWEKNTARDYKFHAEAGGCYIESNRFLNSNAQSSEIIVHAILDTKDAMAIYYQVCQDMLYAAVDSIEDADVEKIMKLIKSRKDGEITIRPTVKIEAIRPNANNAGRMEIMFFSK